MSGKFDFSKPAKLSGSGGSFARGGFLPHLKKCRIPAGAGAEIRYSPSFYDPQISSKSKARDRQTDRRTECNA